jgi:hypothetical protein
MYTPGLPLASLTQATCPAAELRSITGGLPTFDSQDETRVDPAVFGFSVLPTEASQCMATVADVVVGSAGGNASDTIAAIPQRMRREAVTEKSSASVSGPLKTTTSWMTQLPCSIPLSAATGEDR